MPETTDHTAASSTDPAAMNKLQKLAVLLVLLGPEGAGQILRNLEDHEVEALATEMAKLNLISQEQQQAVLQEFAGVAVQATTAVRGGVQFTQSALEKAIGLFKASDVIARVAPMRTPVSAIQQIAKMEPDPIYNLLKGETPQAMALIISFLSPEKASRVLKLLDTDLRDQVIERLATLSPTPIEVVEKLVEVLLQRLGSKHVRALSQSGGAKSAADVLNALEKDLARSILEGLSERNPDLSQTIRQKMFTFEDLANLDASSLQKILREIDLRDLTVALKTAGEAVKTALLGAISRRAAETVREEMSFLGALKAKEVEAAQNRIIEVVRRLESEGEVDLAESRAAPSYETMV